MDATQASPAGQLRSGTVAAAPRMGKLKIFFGYAAGVGKTYAMLEAAHRALDSGMDVVAGYIEPHTRPETMALMEGLEQLPPSQLYYKGISLQEFDLDGALRRRPQLVLVDELAHTNASGSRHLKRYQDVEELLRSGISVYTTVNVQHLESLNDVVAAITGVAVSERIPDHIFDGADKVELVDIEPGELLDRLKEGKVYRQRQTSMALNHFFTEKNLTALREIALRRTADRVGRSPQSGMGKRARTGEHIMICLSSAPTNARVIRTAARMAEVFHSEFTALYVETSAAAGEDEVLRRRLQQNLRLAEELGAKIATVYGDDPAVQIAEYALSSGVSKIVLGRTSQRRRLISGRKTLMDRLIALAPDLDVYIIPDHNAAPHPRRRRGLGGEERLSLGDVARTLGMLALCTGVGALFSWLGFPNANVIMVYLLGVLAISMVTTGRIYSLVASGAAVLIFNFFFTHPYFTFMSDPSYLATFGVMFVAALLSSSLTVRIKRQAVQSAQKASRTQVLLETSQKLQKAEGEDGILTVAGQQLGRLLERSIILYPGGEKGELGVPRTFPVEGEDLTPCLAEGEGSVAQWVWRNNKHAGATTNTLPGAGCLYMAVRGEHSALAVAGVVLRDGRTLDAFQKNLLVAILDECGLALEKAQLAREKRRVEEAAKQEALRANLLRAISHDLRTPLTSISGNAGILMESAAALDEGKKHALYTSIFDDAMWLVDLVENLLSVTRIEDGAMHLNLQPELLDEVFREAADHLDRRQVEHTITTHLDEELLMANMDARLVVQVIINLVNNAIKYTPPGSQIVLSAQRRGTEVEVSVCDNGPGIPDGSKGRLFDMFYTADNDRGDGRRGLGLGLSLCRSIVAAHGGEIWVDDGTPTGACFHFTLHASEVTSCE